MHRTWSILFVVVCVCAIIGTVTPAEAWRDRGHTVIGEIARRLVTPETLEKLELCIETLRRNGPYPMIGSVSEAATWPDDLRNYGLMTMFTWHFVNYPYIPDDYELKTNPSDTVNIETIIPKLISAIKSPKAPSDVIVTSVANLMHFVGDIHMPLHATALFSHQFPKGDRGGTDMIMIIDEKGTTQSLHFYWDNLCLGLQTDAPRPLSPEEAAKIDAFATELLSKHDFTEAERSVTDSSVMASESYELAKTVTYVDIVNGTALPDGYAATCATVANRRVALAGHRLAAVLEDALGQVTLNAIANDVPAKPASKRLSTGGVVGVALGCIVVGALLAVAVLALLRWRCGLFGTAAHSSNMSKEELYSRA